MPGAIRDEVDHVEVVAASVEGDAQLIAGHLNWRSRVTGATPGVFQAREWIVEEGRYLTDADLRGGAKAAIIGQTVAEKLFPGQNPVGQTIRINRVPFQVVGLLVKKGQTTFGRDQDDTVIVPLTTAKQRILGHNRSRADSVRTITIKVSGAEWMSKAEQDVREVLRMRHRLGIDDDDDFRVNNLAANPRNQCRDHTYHDPSAFRRGVGLSVCRRHRYYEHHAGFGDGTNA